MLLKAFMRVPVLVQLRNIGLPSRTASMVLRADHFAPVSRATMLGTLPERQQERSTVVYDGLELKSYRLQGPEACAAARAALGAPEGALVVGMAGRLSPQKGQIFLIEAAEVVVRTQCNVVFFHAGGVPSPRSADPYERQLFERSRSLCERGVFKWIDYMTDMPQFWRAVDIAVVPSSGPEAFGRVVLEAMAMEKPVVATRSGGPEEILASSGCGVLVPMQDSTELAEAVLKLVSDPGRRQALGRKGRELVERTYSAAKYGGRMMDLYQTLMQ